jgi:hypothetical protein
MKILLAALALTACDQRGIFGDYTDAGPTGPFTHFVMDTMLIPSSAAEAGDFSVDVDQRKPLHPDNALGNILTTLAGQQIDAACHDLRAAPLLLLHSIQAADLSNGIAGWHIYMADPPATAAKLDGTDSFTVDLNGPTFAGPRAAYVPGRIVDGKFTGGPANVQIEMAFDCVHPPFRVDLIDARIIADLTDSSCNGKLGGGIPVDEVEEILIPQFAQKFNDAKLDPFLSGTLDSGIECEMDSDCPADASMCQPDGVKKRCTCGLVDCSGELRADGRVGVHELANNPLVKELLAPDLDLDGDGKEDALSFGFKFTCVKASYDVLGED